MVPQSQYVAGAVSYAQSPSTIYARRCRLAYGLSGDANWCEGMPTGKVYTEQTTQKLHCRDRFLPLVRMDDLITHDQVAHRNSGKALM